MRRGRFPGLPNRAVVALALFVAAMLALPLFVNSYIVSVLVVALFAAYFGQAWNIVTGFAGQLSLGHALYVGLGAYASAALFVHYSLSPWIGMLAGMVLSALAGSVVAALSFRFGVTGVYFALLTIAFAELTRIGFDHLTVMGASAGLFLPVSGDAAGRWWNLGGGPLLFYYLALGLALAATLLLAQLRHSPLGYRWLAVREDPQAAQALGINLLRTRITAILISAGMTAVGGVFHAFYYRHLFPSEVFDVNRSIELILAPIIGGLGTVFGPIVGALILTSVGEALTALTGHLGIDLPGVKGAFYGVALAVIISLRPNGVWPWLARLIGVAEHQS